MSSSITPMIAHCAQGIMHVGVPWIQDFMRMGMPSARHPTRNGQAWRTFPVCSPSLTEVICLINHTIKLGYQKETCYLALCTKSMPASNSNRVCSMFLFSQLAPNKPNEFRYSISVPEITYKTFQT